MQRIKLDINPKGETPVLHVAQYDKGRSFEVELVEGEDAYNVPSGYSVQLNVRKTDSKLVTAAPDSIVDNILTFSTTEQMTACAGENIGSITLKDADAIVVTTLYFLISVQRDVLAGGLDSASEIHNLEEQISSIVPEVIGNDYYNKSQTDALLNDKANVSDLPDMSNYYTKSETNGHISALANYVDNKFNDIMPVGSATGNPCTFDTEYPYLIRGLKADIVCGGGYDAATQTSHPLVGHSVLNLTRCGINQFDEVWEKGTINQTTGAEEPNAYISRSGFIPIAPNTRYYYGYSSQNNVRGYYYDSNKNYIGTFIAYANNSFVSDVNASYLRIIIGDVDGTPPLTINYPSTDTEYHAYDGNTFIVAFGQTVYGGVYDKSGRLTIAHATADKDTFTNYDGQTSPGGLHWVSATVDNVQNGHAVASMLEVKNTDEGWVSTTPCLTMENGRLIIYTDRTSLADFKTYYNGLQIAYEIATPIVIDVRPINFVTKDGTNNITSDCIGDVTAYYKDSIQHYIDQRLQ